MLILLFYFGRMKSGRPDHAELKYRWIMRYTEAQVTSELLDQPEFNGEPAKIFICSTPRSGSYMLCRYMINAGLGVPHEYFNPVIMREIAPRLDLAKDIEGLKWRSRGLRDRLPFGKPDRTAEINFLTKYYAVLVRKRCQRGIFAAKIHFEDFITVLDNPVGLKLLDGGLFIHIFREDLLKQAISRNFAFATGRWGIDDTVTTAPLASNNLLSVAGVDRELKSLADQDRGWRVFLARNGLSPMTISYEKFCEDPPGFVLAIAGRLGIDSNTLRLDYNEPISPTRNDDPDFPSRSEVMHSYLAAVRQLRGASIAAEPPGDVRVSPPRRETVE
ncbi:MAG: Stf0 family sulfotransferase [Stellaceae bacterium]